MPRICGASKFHNGSLTNKARTRKARKTRGRKRESLKALRSKTGVS